MWTVDTNLLPTICNLWKRKVAQDPLCYKCQRESEDIFHALMRFKYAKKDLEIDWFLWKYQVDGLARYVKSSLRISNKQKQEICRANNCSVLVFLVLKEYSYL